MKDPIKELRARLRAYHEAKTLYHGPDPYDREEARYRAMCEAQARVGDVALAEALLAAITEAEERGRREAFAAVVEWCDARAHEGDRMHLYVQGCQDAHGLIADWARKRRAEVTP